MAQRNFEEVWQLLHQLKGKTIATLVLHHPNLIVGFEPTGMLRQTEKPDHSGWADSKLVRMGVFKGMWDRLITHGFMEAGQGDWAIAAACLVNVPELGVEYDESIKPRTVILRRAATEGSHDQAPEADWESSNLSRIVLDPNICSGKPTIKGTRIMVTNILSMLAGGYTVERVLQAYPEIRRDDVSAALEYATNVIDEERVIARW